MGEPRLSERNMAAMRSPINWALLSLVIQRPSYGYELVQRLERTYEDTVELSSRSQVYTALDSLSRRGLIEHAEEERLEDPVRQPKLRYRATAAGVCAYERWLTEQVTEDPRRARLLAQHFAALAPEHALRVLERCADICLQVVGRLSAEGGDADGEAEDVDRSQALTERLAGEEQRLRAGAVLGWIEYVRSELRSGWSRMSR